MKYPSSPVTQRQQIRAIYQAEIKIFNVEKPNYRERDRTTHAQFSMRKSANMRRTLGNKRIAVIELKTKV